VPDSMPADILDPGGANEDIESLAVGLLVAVGVIYSRHFLRHFVFPNSDFVSFLRIGRQWIHFQIPTDMKRAPLFSIITALAGSFFSAPDRNLLGTELYNAIMLPAIMVLIYLASKPFLGRTALWVALLAGISPWMVRMGSQPLAELTLVALFTATVLCTRRHIKLAYLFAMLGSIARWDMVALIPAVAIADVIRNRKWLKTGVRTALALIPFGLCMIITKIRLAEAGGGAHYLQVLAEERTFELIKDLNFYWQNICSFLNAPLLQTSPTGQVENIASLNSAVFSLTALLLGAAFLTGSITAIVKKRWEVIVMLLAAGPYVLVHAMYPYRMSRFCVPVAWIGLVIAAYGALVFWQWLTAKPAAKVPATVLKIVGPVLFIVWTARIIVTLSYAERQCPGIAWLVKISFCVIVVGFYILQLARRSKPRLGWLVVPAFLVLAVVSNGAGTGFLMGDGQRGANFKRLALWFLENTDENDRMVTTMAGFMPVYSGLSQKRFAHISRLKPEEAPDFPSFVKECIKEKITLIAWDSRLAGLHNNRYYKLWGLDRIEILGAPFMGRQVRQIGPCKLVHIIAEGSPKMAIYRIIPPAAENEETAGKIED